MRWDPAQYARYSGQRSRPFFDLTAQVDAHSPGRVVDLGCGSGELTATLAQRWPGALVQGIDSSPEMIGKAPAGRDAPANLAFAIGAAENFDATGVDVLVSNALLQWVPGHDDLLAQWSRQLKPKGWLAFQVPANFDAPSHVLMRELAESPTWRERLGGVLRGSDAVLDPEVYLNVLLRQGLQAEVWQTEYLHVLAGPDPVLEWVRGTGLRPVLEVLSAAESGAFTSEYAAELRTAYPAHPFGTVFGFTRTFAVAHKP